MKKVDELQQQNLVAYSVYKKEITESHPPHTHTQSRKTNKIICVSRVSLHRGLERSLHETVEVKTRLC